jgi:hypothetical protein
MAGPLQELAKKANSQIASTKRVLALPSAKGLLWAASDGNEDLQPPDVWFFLNRILQKKGPDGPPQYRNIHGIVYFNPRMPIQVQGKNGPGLFWLYQTRADAHLTGFLKALSRSWIRYNEKYLLRGPFFPVTAAPSALRFAGVRRSMPRIDVKHAPPAKRSK